MKLNQKQLQQSREWTCAGVELPKFDREKMIAATKKAPTWIHVGAGNIFRAFIARIQQTLLEQGLAQTGIVAVSTHNAALVEKIYTPCDNLTLLVRLCPDGTTSRQVIASVAQALAVDQTHQTAREELKAMFQAPSLQMVSFTITEKGYALTDHSGDFLPMVAADFAAGPEHCVHGMSLMTAMLYERYRAGGVPLAMVSMDNCSHNGEKLRTAVVTIARAWESRGFVDVSFVSWLKDEQKVAFPWTMIDKITPRPSQAVAGCLAADGIEGMELVETATGKYDAPFVNAEEPEYLVVEDTFPNGRPAMEKAGVFLTNRETVNCTERMKVTACLNPLHTALAVFGCLLGYPTIAAEMDDPQLRSLAEMIGRNEGLPVVKDPGILSPETFLDEVLNRRLPNPFLPDTPQRIATDTSQKVGVRFGETIKSYLGETNRSVATLTGIPLAIAGWMRYLLALDDDGIPIQCSSDPMLQALQTQLAGVELGQPETISGKLDGILSNRHIFGVDLVAAGMAERIYEMTRQMLSGPGAVRRTLKMWLPEP